MNGSQPPELHPNDRLDSWKEIGSYLRRGVRTVQRWEKERGLPVHRLNPERAQSVFAYRSELDRWWRSESSRGGLSHPRTAVRASLAAALVLLLLGVALTLWRPARVARATRVRPDVTLGLMPLRNLLDDPTSLRLGRELQQALTASLSRSTRIAIIATDRFYDPTIDAARTSADDASSPGLRNAALRVGVDRLLLGNVARIGELLRVNVRVVDAATGEVRATVTSSGADMGVPELAEEIARRIEARLLVPSLHHPQLPTGSACTPAPSGVVGWWPGDGMGGDVIGGPRLVAQGGATFGSAVVGQGLKMPAAGDAFHAHDSDRWHLQQFTVDAWVRATDAGGSGIDGIGGIVAVKVLTDFPHVYPFVSWALAYQPHGGYFSAIVQPAMVSGTPSDYLQSPDGFAAGEFHHVAMTFDGERLKLYVDGVVQAQRLAPGLIDYSDKRLGVGGHAFRGYPYDRTLIGEVDELEIVDRALSPSEISAIYQSGSAGRCRPVRAPLGRD
jgi:TolB-like protein